ncbi:MAG TPA: hypothetical protein VHI78_08835 [Bacteroidales bacterium]|jgi:hypothetical protein|nr:hypothetical protein [Bacteroidales bacterium]
MKKILTLTFLAFLFTGMCLNAQKIALKNGSFAPLKGEKTIMVQYDYSNLSVGKFDKEDDYIAKKVADYNKDEAGKGEKWKESWKADRAARFEPKFELLFNENADNMKVDPAGAKYKAVVHTTFIEPGFNVGVTRKPAYINAEITFTEISSGKEIAFVTVQNCPGRDAMGFDYDTGYRIEEAYAKLGKSLAGFLNKQIK